MVFGPFEILTNNTTMCLLFLFIIFMVIVYLAVKVMVRTILFMIIGATFPFFLKYILSLNIKITALTVLSYAVLGGVLYLCYVLLKALFTTGRVVLSIIRIISLPFRLGFRVMMFLARKVGGGKQKKRDENEQLEIIKSIDDGKEKRRKIKKKSGENEKRKKE